MFISFANVGNFFRSLMYLLPLVITLTCFTNANGDQPVCSHLPCFHQPEEECPPAEDQNRCRVVPHCDKAVICCDVTEANLQTELNAANVGTTRNITFLHIRNATLNKLNLNETISNWRYLRSLSITDGHIKTINGQFGKNTGISCLNLSSNGITGFSNKSLTRLFNITMLDLSHNNLSYVPHFTKQTKITLDISDNNILCISLMETLNKTSLLFNNRDQTYCLAPKTFNWFNSTERISLLQLDTVRETEKSCTVKHCTCAQYGFDIIHGQDVKLTFVVNCANKQLTSLPVPLPTNTIALNVSNNNISTLDEIHDPSYENLRELFADNNKITTILPFEGSKFINNFMMLSLRNNKLKSVPTYFLKNVLDRNGVHTISLGGNKLECDCTTAKLLKVWLLENHEHIFDYKDLWCDNMDLRVIDLNPSKLCQSQDWTDYIYYIITAEVLLLVFLIAKVSYDYWVFKTAGYLPWPASKMPKLPCDWLCE